jgi:hypothetical protein
VKHVDDVRVRKRILTDAVLRNANHPPSAFIAGGVAACGAVTATHPFETVKIRFVRTALPASSPR